MDWVGGSLRSESLNLGPGGHRSYRFLRGILGGLVRQFEADVADPRSAQSRRLNRLLSGAADTAFGDEHCLSQVESFSDFRNAVPIRRHSEMLPWLDRVAEGEQRVLVRDKTRMLLETSGTSGRPKHLPVTRAWEETVQQAQRLWSLGLIRDHAELSSGKLFALVSPNIHGHSPGGLPIGSNTGRIRAAQPYWLRRRYAVPSAVMCIEDAVIRQYVALRFALVSDVRAITTANPSLVLLLFRRLDEWREALSEDIRNGTVRSGPAASIAPAVRRKLERGLRPKPVPTEWAPTSLWNLASVNCWTGGPATFFADRLRTVLDGVPVRELGVNASEGTFAVPLSNDWPGSVLWVGGHLLEFVGRDGEVRWAWELEHGEQYRLIVTTSAGLWRYDMEDVVEVVGFCENTPLIRFVGKSGRFLNAVGERVTGEQVSSAMVKLEGAIDGFTVGVRMGDVPSYVVAFEGKIDGSYVAKTLDSALSELNVEYKSKRESGRLAPPVWCALPPGHYGRYRSQRLAEGAPDGQLKDPVLAISVDEWSRVVQGEDTR
jgi:hypothetical protein